MERGIEDDAAGQSVARARLAEALRESIALTAMSLIDEAVLEREAAALEAMNARLRAAASEGQRVGSTARSPVGGVMNAVAPPSRMWIEGDHVEARVTFGLVYEGPPGHVHGGFVAALMDEVLGRGQVILGGGGMTANLAVRYRRPTPCGVELRATARTESVDERKQTVRGDLWHGDVLLAEAEGLFIKPRQWPRPPGHLRLSTD